MCLFVFQDVSSKFPEHKNPGNQVHSCTDFRGYKTFYIFQKAVSVQPCIFLPACSGQEALGVFFTVHFPS